MSSAMDLREPTAAELHAQGEVPSIVLCAAKKCGKTTTGRWLIRRSVHRTDWFIVDRQGMHWPSMYRGRATLVRKVKDLPGLRREKPGWAYIIREDTGENVARFCLDIGDCAYMDDEADQTVGKDRGIDRESASYQMANINTQRFVSPHWCFRRTADIWLTLQTNCSHAYIGFTQGRLDLKRIEDDFGDDAVRLVRELPDPKTYRDGVMMVYVKMHGQKTATKVFIPHQGE